MKLLLLVQSPDDVQHLPAAANSILNSSITGVWCVFSPAIAVDASEAAAKLDMEIEQLRSAEKAAADRSDYAAAGGYKTQREGKELDRAKALRDAWKTADESARKERTKAIFDPFTATLRDGKPSINIRLTGHSDHYERDQWVDLLNSLRGVWFKPFTVGSFVVGWPESVETSVAAFDWVGNAKEALEKSRETRAAEADHKAVAKEQKPASRLDELSEMHHMSLKPIARALNLDPTGKTKPALIAEILAAEAAPKGEAEPVEAY